MGALCLSSCPIAAPSPQKTYPCKIPDGGSFALALVAHLPLHRTNPPHIFPDLT